MPSPCEDLLEGLSRDKRTIPRVTRHARLYPLVVTSDFIFIFVSVLRACVERYRRSQLSFERLNFGLYHPNNPFIELFQETIFSNTQRLHIWRNLEKFESSQKNTILSIKLV